MAFVLEYECSRLLESEIDQSELKLSCHTAKIVRESIKFMRDKKCQWSAKISHASLDKAILQVLESLEGKTGDSGVFHLICIVFN